MSWTEERIATLSKMWEGGQTASQIAEALGGVSRNAVIGKAHRLGLQSRPSPVKPNEPEAKPAPKAAAAPTRARAHAGCRAEVRLQPNRRRSAPSPPRRQRPAIPADAIRGRHDVVRRRSRCCARSAPAASSARPRASSSRRRSPAPPRRLVAAKPSAEMAGKTTLLDLNDRICKWPLGHPGEPDFHFCGDKVNPGFPYCVAHCGHAYQAQLPRRDRRPPPPLPFGGPRVR